MAETAWEPHYRWWVCERTSDGGWLAVRKTRWRWFARSLARRKVRRGFRVKVEDKG